MSERVMLSARVPEELKQLVDSDQRDNQEVIRAALWREFGGERKAALERRIEEKERRVSLIESEKNERERELQEEKQELQALKTKLTSQEKQREKKMRDTLEKLEKTPWKPDNAAIQTNAEDLDMTPQELIAELEDYHAE